MKPLPTPSSDSPVVSGVCRAEMAVWDPADEYDDAGRALAELDRRSMLLLAGLCVLTLAMALVGVAVTVLA